MTPAKTGLPLSARFVEVRCRCPLDEGNQGFPVYQQQVPVYIGESNINTLVEALLALLASRLGSMVAFYALMSYNEWAVNASDEWH